MPRVVLTDDSSALNVERTLNDEKEGRGLDCPRPSIVTQLLYGQLDSAQPSGLS